jgi:hypothetical protein
MSRALEQEQSASVADDPNQFDFAAELTGDRVLARPDLLGEADESVL